MSTNFSIMTALIVQILTKFIRDSSLADWACVLTIKPLRYAIVVETMKAGQNDVLLLYYVAFLADGALLVLFAEVGRVGLCKLTFREQIEDLRRHWIDHVFVKLEELLILLAVLAFVIRGVLVPVLPNIVG